MPARRIAAHMLLLKNRVPPRQLAGRTEVADSILGTGVTSDRYPNRKNPRPCGWFVTWMLSAER
jgi:hypothetical protein